MKIPTEWNPVEIDLWRERIDMKRLRRDILNIESYGRDIEKLEENEKNG